jgi:hypothetical protein
MWGPFLSGLRRRLAHSHAHRNWILRVSVRREGSDFGEIRPKRATTDPGNQCGPGKQTRSESHLPLLLQRSSAPVRLLTLDQVRMRVDGRAVRLDTIKEVLESILRDVPRRDDDVLVRRMVTAR